MPAPASEAFDSTALRATAAVAAKLNVKPGKQVLICSNGVIGVPIPIDPCWRGLRFTGAALGRRGAPPRQRHPHHRFWPSSRSLLEADLGGQRGADIGGHGKARE